MSHVNGSCPNTLFIALITVGKSDGEIAVAFQTQRNDTGFFIDNLSETSISKDDFTNLWRDADADGGLVTMTDFGTLGVSVEMIDAELGAVHGCALSLFFCQESWLRASTVGGVISQVSKLVKGKSTRSPRLRTNFSVVTFCRQSLEIYTEKMKESCNFGK